MNVMTSIWRYETVYDLHVFIYYHKWHCMSSMSFWWRSPWNCRTKWKRGKTRQRFWKQNTKEDVTRIYLEKWREFYPKVVNFDVIHVLDVLVNGIWSWKLWWHTPLDMQSKKKLASLPFESSSMKKNSPNISVETTTKYTTEPLYAPDTISLSK